MISTEKLRALRTDIDAALAAVGQKHGLNLVTGNAVTYGLTAKFNLAVNSIVGGEVVDKTVAYLRQHIPMLGLKPEHLNQVFVLGGDQFTLHGYKNTGGSKPFVITRVSDGKTFVASIDSVQRALAA